MVKPEIATSLGIEGFLANLPARDRENLAQWNATSRSYRTDRLIHFRVSEKAHEIPQSIAVSAFGRILRYNDLELRSNRLANLLRQRGVGPDVCVGIFTGRTPELVVGALAVLKAGGAYVPLDPSYPQERVSYILHNAGVETVFAVSETSTLLPPGPWEIVDLDPRAGGFSGFSAEALDAGVKPDNLAYVIYTSGSTGQPKGVEITHSSLLNLVHWHLEAFGLCASDRTGLMVSPGFDASVWEIWPTLAAGASLRLPEETTRLSPETLRDWILEQGITVTFVPTILAERLLRMLWPQETKLRFLLTGADVLHRRPPAGLPFTLVNNYGPTECTVVSTSGIVGAAGPDALRPPIGRPIANVEAWILDSELRPVPVGTEGELFIGGAGLGRGYRNTPELTAERFLPHPYAGEGHRIYRTGDRARYLPDGQIEFLGRLDDQIKISGYRIEPAEVMMALNRYADVESSTVIVREDAPGKRQLVAYYVAVPGAKISEESLLCHMRSLLPAYMVPAAFVALASLPMTAHGKVDRSALPSPEDVRLEAASEDYIAPRTPVEESVAGILASLMGLPRVSIHENFFLLGGHSLLGTQVISRVRDAFGIELPLRALFDAPTVADLSSEIERLILRKIESQRQDA